MLTQPSIFCEPFSSPPPELRVGGRKYRKMVKREEMKEVVLDKCILKF